MELPLLEPGYASVHALHVERIWDSSYEPIRRPLVRQVLAPPQVTLLVAGPRLKTRAHFSEKRKIRTKNLSSGSGTHRPVGSPPDLSGMSKDDEYDYLFKGASAPADCLG